MSFLRLFASAASAAVLFCLTCCGSGGGAISAVNPTVAEMDSLDVQWGLAPRKSRGAPRRSYQYQAPSGAGRSAAPAADTPPPRETVNQPPPAGLVPEPAAPSSATIQSLR